MFFLVILSEIRNDCSLIEAEWRMYASVDYAIIGSDNALAPGHYLKQWWYIVH